LLFLSPIKADPPNVNLVSIEQDMQISSNVSDLNFDQLLSSTTGKLALVTITPSKDCGQGKWSVYSYVDIKDPETGTVSHMPNQYILLGTKILGNYSAFDVLTDKMIINSNKYEWLTHFESHRVMVIIRVLFI